MDIQFIFHGTGEAQVTPTCIEADIHHKHHQGHDVLPLPLPVGYYMVSHGFFWWMPAESQLQYPWSSVVRVWSSSPSSANGRCRGPFLHCSTECAKLLGALCAQGRTPKTLVCCSGQTCGMFSPCCVTWRCIFIWNCSSLCFPVFTVQRISSVRLPQEGTMLRSQDPFLLVDQVKAWFE